MNSTAERDSVYNGLKKDGVSMILHRTPIGNYDAALGSVSEAEELYPTYGIIRDYRISELNNSVIQQGDKRIIMGVSPKMPLLGEGDHLHVEVAGILYDVKFCNPIAPAGIPIVFDIQAHRLGPVPTDGLFTLPAVVVAPVVVAYELVGI